MRNKMYKYGYKAKKPTFYLEGGQTLAQVPTEVAESPTLGFFKTQQAPSNLA